VTSGAWLRRCSQQAVPERGDGGLLVDVLPVSRSRQRGILALVPMPLRAIETDHRRAMDALLMRDAASALHRVAGPAVVPLLRGIAVAAPGDVDGLIVVKLIFIVSLITVRVVVVVTPIVITVVVYPVAVGVEACESQASLVQAGHLRSIARSSSYGTCTSNAAAVSFGVASVGARATARVVVLEPWSFCKAGEDPRLPVGRRRIRLAGRGSFEPPILAGRSEHRLPSFVLDPLLPLIGEGGKRVAGIGSGNRLVFGGVSGHSVRGFGQLRVRGRGRSVERHGRLRYGIGQGEPGLGVSVVSQVVELPLLASPFPWPGVLAITLRG